MLVRVRGVPKLYQRSGRFSLVASEILPAGEGSLKMAFERLKKELDQEGLFALSRKRQITRYPERLGLLTANNSQAYSDFVKVLKHRLGGIAITFYPIKVQGNEAVDSILSGFRYFSQKKMRFDAIVLLRGGGSLEDLQAFNDERVVRQIYSSLDPVITGIGHESDWTLADLVADVRASTPSNAAELLVFDKRELLAKLERHNKTIASQLQLILLEKKNFLIKFSGLLESMINKYQHKLLTLSRLLDSLDYRNVLKRGYSITYDGNGQVLKNINQVKIWGSIITKLAVGEIFSQIKQLKTKNEKKDY